MNARTLSIALAAAVIGAALGGAAVWYAMKDGVAVTPVAATPLEPTLLMRTGPTQIASSGTAQASGRTASATTSSGGPGPDVTLPLPPASADPTLRLAAQQRADAVLDSALLRHEWTDADGAALRTAFEDLDADGRNDVLNRFAVAINQGTLVPRTERIPF